MKSLSPSSCWAVPFASLLLLVVSVVLTACKRTTPPPAPQPAQAGQTQTAPTPAFQPTDAALIEAHNRGIGLMGQYQYEAAREVFQKLANEHPNWHDVQVNLAIAVLNRQREGDEAAALSILQRVLDVDQNHVRARYCAGLLRLYLQSPEQALHDLEFVSEQDPSDAYAAYYAGQCLAQTRRYEDALKHYIRAIEFDPYLRSAYYAASQAYRATGRHEEAASMLESFQRMERNPRGKLAKFQYGSMGPKSEVVAIDLEPAPAIPQLPQGPIFADPVPLLTNGEQFQWTVGRSDRLVSITACDLNGDGLIDIFIANVLQEDNVFNAVCMNQGGSPPTFTLDATHVLAKIPNVNAALWGDFDNDGMTDVYLCRQGPNMLWRQTQPSRWTDVTADTKTDNGEFDTVSGLMFDADHDGDLDIFCVNADGPNELLNNNRDTTPPDPPTFAPIAQQQGIAGAAVPSRQVIAADLDGDRDLDIIVINDNPPHDVYINDRLWRYQSADPKLFEQIRNQPLLSMIATDLNADGQVELVATAPGLLLHFERDLISGQWITPPLSQREPQPSSGPQAGFQQVAALDTKGIGVEAYPFLPSKSVDGQQAVRSTSMSAWTPVVFGEPSVGPSIVGVDSTGRPMIWHPGSGRHAFALVNFIGRENPGAGPPPMRSNASGIGTHYAARIDSRWVAGSSLPNHSGPGQSLQPQSIGLGGSTKIDFLAIDWPDGVFQTELDLAAGKLHTIAEAQRVQSSCPVLFAWNGEKFEFITDLLGVGGMGYMLSPDPPTYAPSRPWENVLLPLSFLKPRDGRYQIKLSEPMEEACYLDAARLIAYDLPPEWRMTLDERMGINDPQPTGEPVYYRELMVPVRALNDRGEDLSRFVRAVDLIAAPLPEHDARFIGMLQEDQTLTVRFPLPINPPADAKAAETLESKQLQSPGSLSPILIIDGWIEYPYSQTMFATWQAGAEYRAISIEAQDADGNWHMVLEQFGYPAGMPRQMSVPLPADNLPPGCRSLRMTTNQEIYFDRIAIAFAKSAPNELRRSELRLATADVRRSGFAKRTDGPQRQPYYDYNDRSPEWDTRHQRGWYTEFGRMDELVNEVDDAVAIFGPGEEVHMEFIDDLPLLPQGWTRVFVLETNGWCKDMDLFTNQGETIEPLPTTGKNSSRRDALHRRYNTRFESGR